MEAVYFTNIQAEILRRLMQASRDVKVAMAWFTNDVLYQELLSCLRKGISVELIIADDAINFMEYALDLNKFVNQGGILRIASQECGLMHHKFCVIDEGCVITGSYNWTYNAESRNKENVIITDSFGIVGAYVNEFVELSKQIVRTMKAPRLADCDIAKRKDVDHNFMKQEIACICKAKGCSIPTLDIPTSENNFSAIQVLDNKLITKAKHDIGIEIIADDGEGFKVFIPKGQTLPFKSGSDKLYLNREVMADSYIPCKLIYGDSTRQRAWQGIAEGNIKELTSNVKEENLEIDFSMSLDVGGVLRTELFCEESGREMIVSSIVRDLIENEQQGG